MADRADPAVAAVRGGSAGLSDSAAPSCPGGRFGGAAPAAAVRGGSAGTPGAARRLRRARRTSRTGGSPFLPGPAATAGRRARTGLGLLALGFTLAAVAAAVPAVPLLVVGCLLGGLGAGTATAAAATGIAAAPDPHRVTVRGLLTTSAAASALYLLLPHLGPSAALPFAALALSALAAVPFTRTAGRTPTPTPVSRAAAPRSGPAAGSRLRGTVLAGTLAVWSMAQNALWGVSGRLGVEQVGLDEQFLGLVFASALGGGLLGVLAAGAIGLRLGRAVPICFGTLTIAGCAALTGTAVTAVPFTAGELVWNLCYPFVFSHLIGAAAALDRSGRWAVLAGAASSFGVAWGPLVGASLVAASGYPGLGAVLAGLLAVTAVPLTLVARRRTPPPAPVPVPVIRIPAQRRSQAAESARHPQAALRG
ncbi:MFS transporter [Kitasatospora terrestris]|uniref:MFS transporter n=1 Tax=Kitasatospora terrestris TaxID=258051 RepID=A0ABP9DK19_9ACTN